MVGSPSKPSVLECMLKNFKKGFSGDYGVKLFPWKLRHMYELDWLTFGVGCSPKGTLDIPTVKAVYRVVMRDPGHPDQFSYTDQWLE